MMLSNERHEPVWLIISTYSFISMLFKKNNNNTPVQSGYDQIMDMKTELCIAGTLNARDFFFTQIIQGDEVKILLQFM